MALKKMLGSKLILLWYNVFKNKNVLVTGGTRGIGAATVKLFRSLGANVTFTGRSHLIVADGYYCIDFSDLASLGDFVKEIETRDIDILVNNAAFIEPVTSIDDISEQDLKCIWGSSRSGPICSGKSKSFIYIWS